MNHDPCVNVLLLIVILNPTYYSLGEADQQQRINLQRQQQQQREFETQQQLLKQQQLQLLRQQQEQEEKMRLLEQRTRELFEQQKEQKRLQEERNRILLQQQQEQQSPAPSLIPRQQQQQSPRRLPVQNIEQPQFSNFPQQPRSQGSNSFARPQQQQQAQTPRRLEDPAPVAAPATRPTRVNPRARARMPLNVRPRQSAMEPVAATPAPFQPVEPIPINQGRFIVGADGTINTQRRQEQPKPPVRALPTTPRSAVRALPPQPPQRSRNTQLERRPAVAVPRRQPPQQPQQPIIQNAIPGQTNSGESGFFGPFESVDLGAVGRRPTQPEGDLRVFEAIPGGQQAAAAGPVQEEQDTSFGPFQVVNLSS